MIAAFATLEELWPWAGAVLGLLALLYLLEPRRRRVEVPFGALWKAVLARAESRRIGRRWRRILSWLLMSSIAAAMLAALADGPLGLAAWTERRAPPPRHTVVLVDVSASMATLDGDRGEGLLARSRLDEARVAVDGVLANAAPGERFLLVAAAAAPRTQAPWADDTATIRTGMARLQPTDAGLDLERALAAADAALRGRSDGQIVVVSDGGRPIAVPSRPPASPLRWVLVGPAGRQQADVATAAGQGGDAPIAPGAAPAVGIDNVAVVRVGVRASSEDPGRGVVTARIRNDRAVDVEVRVELASRAEGASVADFGAASAVVAEQRVTLPARSEQAVTFTAVDLVSGRFAVHVRPAAADGVIDLAPWDDWGFAVAAQRRRLGVLLVGDDNLFLEAALVANDRFTVKRLTVAGYAPQAWTAAQRLQHGIDVVVLDQVPAPAPDGVPALRLDLRSHPDAAAGAADPRPALELSARTPKHPVLRGVSLHDANVDVCRVLDVPTGSTVLWADRDGAAVALASDVGVRRVDFGLDLVETDIGGRYLMPLLIANAIEWLASEEEVLVSPLEVGRPWAIGLPVQAATWTWAEPGTAPVTARWSDDALLGTSERAGIHVWRSDSGYELARPTVLPGTERPDAWTVPGPRWQRDDDTVRSAHPAAPWPAWSLLAAMAAALLWVEWGLYQRRRTV